MKRLADWIEQHEPTVKNIQYAIAIAVVVVSLTAIGYHIGVGLFR